jgi:hypothetical protein
VKKIKLKALVLSATSLAASVFISTSGVALAQAVDTDPREGQLPPVAARVPEGYAQLGIRRGAFIILPKLSTSLEYNDNVLYDDNNKVEDFILTLNPEIRARSNWGRHALNLSASAIIRQYGDNQDENSTSADFRADGRFDLVGRSSAYGFAQRSRVVVGREAPDTVLGAIEPVEYDLSVLRGGTQIGLTRWRLIVEISSSMFDYKSIKINSGARVSLNDRDFKRNTVMGKGEFFFTPETIFYIEAMVNDRAYDTASIRDSDGYEIAVGGRFDTGVLRGDVRVGYMKQSYNNPLFKPSKGPAFRGQVNWSLTRLTDVTFIGERSIEESPTIIASGFMQSNIGVRVDHELLRQLVISGSINHTVEDFNGFDRRNNRNTFTVGGKYLIDRTRGVSLSYSRASLNSTGGFALPDYVDNRLTIGLTLQY